MKSLKNATLCRQMKALQITESEKTKRSIEFINDSGLEWEEPWEPYSSLDQGIQSRSALQ